MVKVPISTRGIPNSFCLTTFWLAKHKLVSPYVLHAYAQGKEETATQKLFLNPTLVDFRIASRFLLFQLFCCNMPHLTLQSLPNLSDPFFCNLPTAVFLFAGWPTAAAAIPWWTGPTDAQWWLWRGPSSPDGTLQWRASTFPRTPTPHAAAPAPAHTTTTGESHFSWDIFELDSWSGTLSYKLWLQERLQKPDNTFHLMALCRPPLGENVGKTGY